jgi:hypothetical protein
LVESSTGVGSVDWIQTAILSATAVVGAAAVWVQHVSRQHAAAEADLLAVAEALGDVLEALIDTSAITGEEPRFSLAKSRLRVRLQVVNANLGRSWAILDEKDVPTGRPAADWVLMDAALAELAHELVRVRRLGLRPIRRLFPGPDAE